MKKIALITFVLFLSPAFVRAENVHFNRKAGLWEIQIGMGGQQPGSITTKQCVDEKTDAVMQEMGQGVSKNCTKQEMKKEGDAYVADSECKLGATTVKSHAVFKGDFNSTYSGEIAASYDPPMMNMKETKTEVTAKWLGACEAGMEPGDTILPNGMKMNVVKMKQMMPGGPAPATAPNK